MRDIDAHLSEAQAADCRAYCALLLGVLADVEAWVMWADPVHYSDVVWPLLSRTVLAPLRWLVPSALRRRHAAALAHAGWGNVHVLRAAAMSAYAALGSRLATSSGPFLFGDRPTSADALLYGHLASVRHALPGEWVAAAGGPGGGGLLRAYEVLRHELFDAETNARSAPARHLLGTGGAVNLFEALDRAIDVRRVRSATTLHSRHAFARTTNAEALLPLGRSSLDAPAQSSSPGASPAASVAAGGAPTPGWWSWAAAPPWRQHSPRTSLSASRLSASALDASALGASSGSGGEGGADSSAPGELSVRRWGFGADQRLLKRSVAAVLRSADGGSAAAWDLVFAGALAALALVAVRSTAPASRP